MKQALDISDNELVVKALKAGDATAFKAVYLAYSGSLRRYAAVILQDAEDAYEVVQDTFVSVWLNRQSLHENKSLKNYLLRAVHNNALHFLKLAVNRKLREGKVMADRLKGEEKEEALPGKEALALAIARLPEQSRKVLLMSYWEDKKNAEIAKELSISVRTVETILYKVMKKLRGEIKKN